jgi:Glycosyl hydrolases family 2, TIM barrel domain/Glycosyl hydrolases family 2, sugar binding domain
MRPRHALIAAVLMLAVAALAFGARAGGMPARDPVVHAPVAAGGPTGRVALDGVWTVRVQGRSRTRRVHVPYSPNASVVSGPAGKASFQGGVATYRTALQVPADGDYAIRFESVNHRASVFVDGRLVARHTGAYLPFEARTHLSAGRHALVVRADWRSPQAMKAAAWHRVWFNFGGVDREVTIRPLGASEIDAPGLLTRVQPDGSALVDVTARVHNRGAPRPLQVLGRLGARPLRFAPVTVPAGRSATVRAQLRIARPNLWAPGHPALQTLQLSVAGEPAGGWRSKVGLRDVRWTGGRLWLNGAPLVLRGASLQEDAPGRGDALRSQDMDATVARLQAIGANATRSQHPLNAALLERLDAAGILVWQGVGPVDAPGAWTATTPALRRQGLRRVRLDVVQARTHPSVLAWNLANEVANNGHAGGQAQFIDSAAQLVHRLDPGRPVALDVWGTHMPARAGFMYRNVDAIGGTNYEGWYDDLHADPRTVDAGIVRWLGELRAAFPGKVLAVTEFGAEANTLNPTAGPGGLRFQAQLLARHIRIYRAQPWLSGMLVWNLQDFALSPDFAGGSVRREAPDIALVRGINQKGLFTYSGRPKLAAAVVRRLYAEAR